MVLLLLQNHPIAALILLNARMDKKKWLEFSRQGAGLRGNQNLSILDYPLKSVSILYKISGEEFEKNFEFIILGQFGLSGKG